jgi:hypothetical protein
MYLSINNLLGVYTMKLKVALVLTFLLVALFLLATTVTGLAQSNYSALSGL